jgi:hypothetical protein
VLWRRYCSLGRDALRPFLDQRNRARHTLERDAANGVSTQLRDAIAARFGTSMAQKYNN